MSVRYTNFGGQLVHENRGGVETSFVPDTLGSVMMCRDANGNTIYEAEYWPYGEVRTETGTNPSPWGFVGTLGYYTDEKSKSLYVRARTYLPDYARWATVDPLWPRPFAYGYVDGTPQSWVDPHGLWRWRYVDDPSSDRRLIWNSVPYMSDIQAFIGCLKCFEIDPDRGAFGGESAYAGEALEAWVYQAGGAPSFEITILDPGIGWPFTNPCNDRSICAYTQTTGLFGRRLGIPRIHICRHALNNPGCGPLRCMILHELLHAIGMDHKPSTDAAFLCLRSVLGCENFGSRSGPGGRRV